LGHRSRSPLLLLSGLWASAGRVSGRRSCSDHRFHFCGLQQGVCRDVGPAPTFASISVGCGLQRGVCRDVGPAPTLASISVGCGLQRGVCRDVGPAPTLAVLSCGLWASAGRVSGRRSCSDPCFNFVGCGLQRGVCRDVGPAPTLASILWAVGFSGRVSGYRSQVRSIFSYVPIVIFLSRSKMQFEGHRSEANLVAHFTSR